MPIPSSLTVFLLSPCIKAGCSNFLLMLLLGRFILPSLMLLFLKLTNLGVQALAFTT